MLTPINIVILHLMSWQYLVGRMFQNVTIIPRQVCAVPRLVNAKVDPAVGLTYFIFRYYTKYIL